MQAPGVFVCALAPFPPRNLNEDKPHGREQTGALHGARHGAHGGFEARRVQVRLLDLGDLLDLDPVAGDVGSITDDSGHTENLLAARGEDLLGALAHLGEGRRRRAGPLAGDRRDVARGAGRGAVGTLVRARHRGGPPGRRHAAGRPCDSVTMSYAYDPELAPLYTALALDPNPGGTTKLIA